MIYDDTFKDEIKGVNGQYVYGVQNNGDIYVTNFIGEYGLNCKDYLLGKYLKRDELPKNPYNWDIDSIPSVKEFHIWICENMKDVSHYVNIQEELIYRLDSIESKNELINFLKNTIEKLNKV